MKQSTRIQLLCTMLFGIAVVLFFGLAYPHHLHHQEQFQLFLFDSSYVWEIVKLPGGISDLLGRFCTQFFLFAWVGALIIGLLLTSIHVLTLRLSNRGRLYGLSFVPAGLLWLFLLDENALLGGVWAVLLTLLASWGFDKLSEGWIHRVLFVIAIPLLYWAAGPVCLIFILLLARRSDLSPWYYSSIVLLLAMPTILSHHLPVSAGSLWSGIHYHRYPTEFPTLVWLAALSIFFLALIARIFHRWANASIRPVAQMLSFLIVAIGLGLLVQQNSNFKSEKAMKYDFMARHQQWNRILETINDEKPNNQIGVTVQNLALAMRHRLVDHMFEYNQNGVLGLLPDVERDAMGPLPTAEAFYQLGMIYTAQRSVFEAQEAILDFQKSARCYKRLAQTNLILGEYEVARKYLRALQKTLFYREWADETLPLLGDEEAIAKHPEYGRLRELAYDEDFYFSDHSTPEMLGRLFFSNTKNRLAYEYLMAHFLLTGDLEGFVNNVAWGEQLGYPAIPRHFQEAWAIWWSLNQRKGEKRPEQISAAIAQRFNQFFTASQTQGTEGLAKHFGDTYWYYYIRSFNR